MKGKRQKHSTSHGCSQSQQRMEKERREKEADHDEDEETPARKFCFHSLVVLLLCVVNFFVSKRSDRGEPISLLLFRSPLESFLFLPNTPPKQIQPTTNNKGSHNKRT